MISNERFGGEPELEDGVAGCTGAVYPTVAQLEPAPG